MEQIDQGSGNKLQKKQSKNAMSQDISIRSLYQQKDTRLLKNTLLSFISERTSQAPGILHSTTLSQLDPILEDEFFSVAVALEVWKREQLLATPLFYHHVDESDELKADQLKLLQFFLPHAATLEKNLPLLERCFASFFDDQVLIKISEAMPRFQQKSYSGIPLGGWCLDARAPLAGEGFNRLPSIVVKLEIQDRSIISKYIPGSTNWKLLEQYLCKLFLAGNYDWNIKLVAVDSAISTSWQLDQENAPCYLGINTVLS
ncbi:MAG: hypothetical protein AAF433_00160 [Bacteroidota bacterium]